jgi:hypothetical protein
VNPSKTEFLLAGTRQQRSNISSASLTFRGTVLTSSTHVRNLGVIFDADLTFKNHISSLSSSSFHQIRQLRQIRSSLDTASTALLATSLVSTKLDYCNSLFYGLPSSTINRIQRIQNSLARVVVPSTRRYHHISPVLKELHWLPVSQRITYKIASLTFKTLHYKQPSYLFNILSPYTPLSKLRSSNKHHLTVPLVKSELGRRAFSYAAPFIWNSLPLSLRSSSSIDSFLSSLKTYLFPP